MTTIIEQLCEAMQKALPGRYIVEDELDSSCDCEFIRISTGECGTPDYHEIAEVYADTDTGEISEQDWENARLIALARTHLPALLAVCDAAKEMREATKSYVAEAELEPPHCDLARQQAARDREAHATQALDSALATLTQDTSKP